MEKLTCQNEELERRWSLKIAKHRRTGENQNEEESNSQANRQDRISGEDSTRMENELRNMRKEVDELKSAMGQRRRESGWDDSKDGLTLHH